MTSLPRFSVNNPVLVNLFMVTLLVGGAYSGLTLVREMFPESRPDRVMITTLYPGASPAEVEKGITLKIEEQVKDIDGVEKITSSVTEGRSLILVELRSGFELIDQAVDDIKSAIDSIPPDDFPEDALETQVSKFEPRLPVISISMFGETDDRTLKMLGDRLRNDVLALSGISDAVLAGTRKDEISIEVRPHKLVEFGLSFKDVANAVASSNLDLPGGMVRTSGANVAVRTLGEKDRGDELYDIVIRSDTSGRVVRVSDVANIVDGFEDVEISGRFNGMPSVSVTVYKTADQDAIDIAEKCRALVAGKMGRPLERPWQDEMIARITGRDIIGDVYAKAAGDPYPPGINVETRGDLAPFIEGRLDLLKRNGMWGLLLVFLSLLVFLHWRVAFWVMMGLVLAITGALICMRLMGLTLNLMTMGGFIIVLGLLVDDAIIVSEHVYSKVEQGIEPKLAAIAGAEEVTWPVVCAIVTTIVAFVPLRYIDGQIGDWMGILPVIVCVALVCSLVEALTILPSHLAHGLRPRMHAEESDAGSRKDRVGRARNAFGSWQVAFLHRTLSEYERLLRVATRYRYVTVGALCSCLIVVGGAMHGGHVPIVLLQKMDSEMLLINLRMGVGAPIEVSREAAGVVERAALAVDEVKSAFTLLGLQVNEEGILTPPQSHLAQVIVELSPADQRTRSSDEITNVLRRRTTDIPGVDKLTFAAIHGGPGGRAIHLDISGERLADTIAVAEEIREQLAGFDGVSDIIDDFDAGRPEAQIELFDSARALGLTTQSLATQVRSAFYGFEARKVQRGREDVKIMVRYPPEFRRRVYDIESMRVATPTGDLVPFTEVARLTEGTGYASIKRTNQKRTVTVTADVDETVTNANQVMSAMTAMFPDIARRYPGIELSFGGQQLEMAKSFGSLRQAFVVALLLIFVILAGLFKSYVQPLLVMAIIPFGLIGAAIGHYLMGYPITIASMLGLVALTGVVVNDAMILVVFINRRVEHGVDASEAVIEGGKGRLRPILLTSVTTVLGMAPLLLETSFQAKFLIPMGISISAGLIFATVLTLIAVPSLYLIVLDFKRIVSRLGLWLWGGTPLTAESRATSD